MEFRSSNLFRSNTDAYAVVQFEALELVYWNEWETACKFEDETRQTLAMQKISMLQDIKRSFLADPLGR